MPFEDIEYVGAPKPSVVPPDGVSVSARKMGTRGGATARYIKVIIGEETAKALVLRMEEVRLRVQFGTALDYGAHQPGEKRLVGARRSLGLVEFEHQVLPGTGIELPAIQALQGELARQHPRRVAPRHA